jgi:hypothetical protein
MKLRGIRISNRPLGRQSVRADFTPSFALALHPANFQKEHAVQIQSPPPECRPADFPPAPASSDPRIEVQRDRLATLIGRLLARNWLRQRPQAEERK